MQSESLKWFVLYDEVYATYKTILECFIKPDCIELTHREKTISNKIIPQVWKLKF